VMLSAIGSNGRLSGLFGDTFSYQTSWITLAALSLLATVFVDRMIQHAPPAQSTGAASMK